MPPERRSVAVVTYVGRIGKFVEDRSVSAELLMVAFRLTHTYTQSQTFHRGVGFQPAIAVRKHFFHDPLPVALRAIFRRRINSPKRRVLLAGWKPTPRFFCNAGVIHTWPGRRRFFCGWCALRSSTRSRRSNSAVLAWTTKNGTTRLSRISSGSHSSWCIIPLTHLLDSGHVARPTTGFPIDAPEDSPTWSRQLDEDISLSDCYSWTSD